MSGWTLKTLSENTGLNKVSKIGDERPVKAIAIEEVDLPAVLGGQPAFHELKVVGRPNMPNREAFLTRVGEILDSKQFTNFGPQSDLFEQRVAEAMGVKHCIAMCNGTIAMELAITALDLKGEIIVPSFTFIATVHAAWRQGLRPVFVDVDPVTHTLDPDAVREAITSQTSAILAVSLWGNYNGEADLREIADTHGLSLLYDSAHSFGCSRENGSFDQLCDLEALSFHATKCVHAMEGGAILTNDDELAKKLRLMVNFGFDGEDNVIHLGTNAKMNEIEAAMGLTSLEAASDIFARNRANMEAYEAGLAAVPGLSVMSRDADTKHNFQYVVVHVDEELAGLSRDEIVAALRLENVMGRRYFMPGCHRMEPYKSLFPLAGRLLPVTEALSARVMILPNGLAVEPKEATLICDRIAALVARAQDVRAALKVCKDDRLPNFG